MPARSEKGDRITVMQSPFLCCQRVPDAIVIAERPKEPTA